MGGAGLLAHYYNNSTFLFISTVFSDYEWLPWRFHHTPQGYWSDMKNQRKFMDWAANELKIKDMSDWYKITAQVIFFTTFF